MSLIRQMKIQDSIDDSYVARVYSDRALRVRQPEKIERPIDALFAQSISNFTLSADTGESGLTAGSLVYTFAATAGHGIVATNEVLLLDVAANRSLQAVVISVAVNVITIDRPIDHVYASATTLGRIVTTNMAVDGSVTPQIFTLRSGAVPTHVTRVIITMLDGTSMDDGKFGGITALTNGLVFRAYDGFNLTIFNFKTNGDIAQMCFDTTYADKAPAGNYGFNARITFAGDSKHGVVLEIRDLDVLQWVVQDDLTGLISLKIAAQGHLAPDIM